MVLQLGEITRGLVALLDPAVFANHGGCCDLPEQKWVKGSHLFACLQADDVTSVWVELTSKFNEKRVLVPKSMKIGDPRWIEQDTYMAHPHQVWYGPNLSVVEASQDEATWARQRNSIHLDFIERLADRCRMPSREQMLACRSILTHPQ